MTAVKEAPAEKKAGLGSRLYNGETQIDFIGRQRRGFIVSAVVILLGIGAVLLNGLNLGIDFRGGTSWEIPADVSVKQVQDLMADAGFPDAKVQRFTPASGDAFVRVSARVEGGDAAARDAESITVRDKLAPLANGKPVDYSTVGPSWGNEITNKARNALVVFFLVIAAYLAIRFEWRMAVGALAAVVHDIFVTIGVYALTGLEVTPASVVAFLTILGFSLYDTVVVFDRVDENAKALAHTGRATYSDVVTLSMNQTLMRSLNTSLVAVLPILSVLVIGTFILGATTLRDFGMALLIGLITGAYSSVFIASPVLALLKEREPRYRQLRARLEQRGGTGIGLLTPAGAARAGLSGSGGGKPKVAAGKSTGPRPVSKSGKGKRPATAGSGAAVLRPGGSTRAGAGSGPDGDAGTEPEIDLDDEVEAQPLAEDDGLVEANVRPSSPAAAAQGAPAKGGAKRPANKGGRPGGANVQPKARKKGKRR
jgi:preprotein translocase subunit SecF